MRRRELKITWRVTNHVAEGETPAYGSVMRGPADAVRYLSNWAAEAQEVFVLLVLDARMKIIGHAEVGRGGISSAPVSVTALCRAAVMSGGAAVIVAHNHPSGDTTPSEPDRAVTAQLKKALEILEIPLLDHIIVGIDQSGNVCHTSFRDAGRF